MENETSLIIIIINVVFFKDIYLQERDSKPWPLRQGLSLSLYMGQMLNQLSWPATPQPWVLNIQFFCRSVFYLLIFISSQLIMGHVFILLLRVIKSETLYLLLRRGDCCYNCQLQITAHVISYDLKQFKHMIIRWPDWQQNCYITKVFLSKL